MAQYRLLLVDADPLALQTIYGILGGNMDLELRSASSGAKALELTDELPFDCILISMELPDESGIALCQELRNRSSTKAVPVVIISLINSEANIEASFKAGATAYLTSYELGTRLLDVVQNILKKQDMRQGRTILVVDDAPSVCDIVEEALTLTGFTVIKAYNGREALKALESVTPDLIISDIVMPEIDGITLLKTVRSWPEKAAIPFMAMSAFSERSYLLRMQHMGVEAYMVKPFNMDHLVMQVEQILANNYNMLLKKREFLERERGLLLGTITSLVAALEARDPYTHGHSENVANIVSQMVKIAGGSEADVEAAYLGGRLHDIGKIGIPDAILLKPGPLNSDEMQLIQQHPVIGAHILEPISSLAGIISIVLYHHERYDGTGYPNRLKGKEIPLWARMTAVADVYDALSSDRPYRPSMSIEQTMSVITSIRGSHLCPECTDIFMEWVKQQEFFKGDIKKTE